MGTALQWFTAAASSTAGLSALGGIYLQLRKERPRASVESGLVFDDMGNPWKIAITVHCMSKPFTVTGAGWRMEGGSIIRPGDFEPALLQEGQAHHYYLPFSALQAVIARPMIGLPLYPLIDAAGTRFKGKLDWGVRHALNGEFPNDFPSRVRRATSFLPTPGRRRFRRLLNEARAMQSKADMEKQVESNDEK